MQFGLDFPFQKLYFGLQLVILSLILEFELLLSQFNIFLMTIPLDLQLYCLLCTSIFKSSIRLFAFFRARSFIWFYFRSCWILPWSGLLLFYSSIRMFMFFYDILFLNDFNYLLLIYYQHKFISKQMTFPTSKSKFIQDPQSIIIKPLKPLIFNFFVSERPDTDSQTLEDVDFAYRSFQSQKLNHKNNHYFKPTMNHKKLNDQPKFRLSLEKKKSKVLNGMSQKASSQRPSRNSYRGSKVRSINNREAMNQQSQFQVLENTNKKQTKDTQPMEPSTYNLRKKARQPHLHFNLKHILQTSKTFTGQFSREQNIQGSNFPYYNYFSSQKSSIPKSQKSARLKSNRPQQTQRFISTTVGVRQFRYNI